MNVLFEPYEFAGIKLRNRFVRSATVNNLTNEENRITPEIHKLHIDLARGGVGLIRERPRCVVTTREDGTPRKEVNFCPSISRIPGNGGSLIC